MPYLQLDVSGQYSTQTKQRLAGELSRIYAEMMTVDIRRISIAIRELGEGGVWRVTEEGTPPVPVNVMMLDIREGRSAERRMALAKALCAICVATLKIEETHLNVEFTQHSGDEMYHPALGGFSPDWTPDGG